MKSRPSLKLALYAGAAALFATGCVTHEVRYQPAPVVVQAPPPPPSSGTEVIVTGPPPPAIQETVTISPGPQYVWIPGAWAWRGHWVWGPGHWVVRPRPGAVWITPHYAYRHGRHVYVRGGWRY